MKWSRPKARLGRIPALALGSLPFLLSGCAQRQPLIKPSIEFSIIPQAEEGGPDKSSPIAGRVIGAWTSAEQVLGFGIAPAFWQTWWFRLAAVLAIGSGSRAQPRGDRRGICRFEIYNYLKGEHHDPNHWYTTRQRADS